MSKRELRLLDGNFDMSSDERSLFIEISAKSKLTPQAIVDAVVDMVSSYYAVTKEEWEAMSSDDLDS